MHRQYGRNAAVLPVQVRCPRRSLAPVRDVRHNRRPMSPRAAPVVVTLGVFYVTRQPLGGCGSLP